MVVYLLVGHGLVGAMLWWMLADLSGIARIGSGAALAVATASFLMVSARRARKLRSDVEGHPPQVMRHDGSGERRRHEKSADDPEMFVTDRW